MTAQEVDLGSLLDEGDDAIVMLVSGDTRLIVHRAVLAARSPVFAAMFGHETLEASSGKVTIADVEGPVLRQLVTYLYSLQAPKLVYMAPELLAAADKYGVSGLKEECEKQLVERLSVENVVAAAVLAATHSCPGLQWAAVALMKAHIHQVMATQDWADAVVNHPRAVVEFTRQIPEQSAESWKVSVQERDKKLIAAAKKGAVEEIQMLLTPAADIEARDQDNMTALHRAADNNQVEAVKCLLEHGAEVNVRDHERNTPLHWAAANADVGAVQLLLAASADPNARCWNGRTPLHDATVSLNVDAVSALVEAGADRGARDNFGETPSDIARRKNHQQLIKILS